MGKDWVVWLGCISLFGAGAIWGAVPIGTEFFTVENIHDLAEIVGALATAIAVCLAAAGINAWRIQTVATSDHELARRAAVILERYKFSLYRGWEYADYLVFNMEHELGKGGITQKALEEAKDRLNELEMTKSQTHSVALECRAIWGEDVWELFERAFWLDDKCRYCIGLYLRWVQVDDLERNRRSYASVASQIFREVKLAAGKDTDSVNAYIDRSISHLSIAVRNKFLR